MGKTIKVHSTEEFEATIKEYVDKGYKLACKFDDFASVTYTGYGVGAIINIRIV